jgi:tRNA 2-selenouridine synthase
VVLEAPLDVRVELLKGEYSHYLAEPELFAAQLACLVPLHGRETIARWQSMAARAASNTLVEELLVDHYDPAYTRSMRKHYAQLERAPRFMLTEASDSGFAALASALLNSSSPRPT